jgi:Gpi18-like mannosyltransferase
VLAASAEPGRRWLRKAAADPSLRIAGSLWLASKIAIFALGWMAAWIMSPGSRHPLRLTSVWEHWDATEFRGIAEYGYFGGPDKSNPNQAAFFPGYPLLLRGVHVLVPAWTADELIIGTVASFFAILGLVQLAEDYRAGSGAWAGVFLLAAPAAVFLAVGYSEAPFLAFALPAWRAARRGSWIWASLLAAGACALRVNGLFLVGGMIVMILLAKKAADAGIRRPCALAAMLLIPLVPVTAYVIYLHYRTGD